ncbi:hypothetical protein BJ165DRAFT_509238 [Panaeolus papilionaceus]|nr:hypothetical protein BJ165DRAFT_509238 [Panaeolus papilionaceus]
MVAFQNFGRPLIGRHSFILQPHAMAKSRKTKKRKTNEEVFVVEVITKARVVAPDTDDEDVPPKNTKGKGKEKQKLPKAKWEYYVKWAGYGSDADSWEPQENVSSCVRLLQSFWDHVGTDNKDYLPGYEVSAKESWIKKEKAFFVRELKSEVSKTKKGSDKSKSKRRKASPSEPSKRPSKEKKVSIKEESSDDDRPLALNFPSRPAPPRPEPVVIPGKRKRMVVSSDDEDSVSNTPIMLHRI